MGFGLTGSLVPKEGRVLPLRGGRLHWGGQTTRGSLVAHAAVQSVCKACVGAVGLRPRESVGPVGLRSRQSVGPSI